MATETSAEGYERIPSSVDDLEVFVRDDGASRSVRINGRHVVPRGSYRCPHSEIETQLSVETLGRIAAKYGRHLRDEIERSEDPFYMQRGLKIVIEEFSLELAGGKILDFGCGAGSFAVNLLRLGATDVTCVDVDEELLGIAEARLGDFFEDGYRLAKIDYLDRSHRMPFGDGEFDIVWPHAVMEHVLPSQRRSVLAELWRVLKNGGLLVIDSTPNRLWIKESHTSDLYFVNYLPLALAAGLARRFSERVPEDQSTERLLSRGFRGCTYWEIAGALPASVCLNTVRRRTDLAVWMRGWRKPWDSVPKRAVKETYGVLMRVADPVLAVFGIPQTAFLPWHCMVFRKL